MGFKKINQFKLLDAAAVSGTATTTSSSQSVANFDNVFLQVRFAGTMAGTLTVQQSADGVLWDDTVFSPVLAQPSGSALAYSISMSMICSQYLRISYVNSSGSGTLSVTLFSKDLN
jgi:hypothetical protein